MFLTVNYPTTNIRRRHGEGVADLRGLRGEGRSPGAPLLHGGLVFVGQAVPLVTRAEEEWFPGSPLEGLAERAEGGLDGGLEAVGPLLPGLDYVRLAEGYGCEARRVTAPGDLEAALRGGLAATCPTLLEVAVDPAIPSLI